MDRQIETASGELVDSEILKQTTHDPRLDFSSLPDDVKLEVESPPSSSHRQGGQK
jgi:hypothetical protein